MGAFYTNSCSIVREAPIQPRPSKLGLMQPRSKFQWGPNTWVGASLYQIQIILGIFIQIYRDFTTNQQFEWGPRPPLSPSWVRPCKPSPSPYTDFASIPPPIPLALALALGHHCLSNHASSHINAYNRGTTRLPSPAWELSLPLHNSSFCRTMGVLLDLVHNMVQIKNNIYTPSFPN
jgi:hypothetical protein